VTFIIFRNGYEQCLAQTPLTDLPATKKAAQVAISFRCREEPAVLEDEAAIQLSSLKNPPSRAIFGI
jgi:hypothetical protein